MSSAIIRDRIETSYRLYPREDDTFQDKEQFQMLQYQASLWLYTLQRDDVKAVGLSRQVTLLIRNRIDCMGWIHLANWQKRERLFDVKMVCTCLFFVFVTRYDMSFWSWGKKCLAIMILCWKQYTKVILFYCGDELERSKICWCWRKCLNNAIPGILTWKYLCLSLSECLIMNSVLGNYPCWWLPGRWFPAKRGQRPHGYMLEL